MLLPLLLVLAAFVEASKRGAEGLPAEDTPPNKKARTEMSARGDPFEEVPDDVWTAHIFPKADCADLVSMLYVSRTFSAFATQEFDNRFNGKLIELFVELKKEYRDTAKPIFRTLRRLALRSLPTDKSDPKAFDARSNLLSLISRVERPGHIRSSLLLHHSSDYSHVTKMMLQNNGYMTVKMSLEFLRDISLQDLEPFSLNPDDYFFGANKTTISGLTIKLIKQGNIAELKRLHDTGILERFSYKCPTFVKLLEAEDLETIKSNQEMFVPAELLSLILHYATDENFGMIMRFFHCADREELTKVHDQIFRSKLSIQNIASIFEHIFDEVYPAPLYNELLISGRSREDLVEFFRHFNFGNRSLQNFLSDITRGHLYEEDVFLALEAVVILNLDTSLLIRIVECAQEQTLVLSLESPVLAIRLGRSSEMIKMLIDASEVISIPKSCTWPEHRLIEPYIPLLASKIQMNVWCNVAAISKKADPKTLKAFLEIWVASDGYRWDMFGLLIASAFHRPHLADLYDFYLDVALSHKQAQQVLLLFPETRHAEFAISMIQKRPVDQLTLLLPMIKANSKEIRASLLRRDNSGITLLVLVVKALSRSLKGIEILIENDLSDLLMATVFVAMQHFDYRGLKEVDERRRYSLPYAQYEYLLRLVRGINISPNEYRYAADILLVMLLKNQQFPHMNAPEATLTENENNTLNWIIQDYIGKLGYAERVNLTNKLTLNPPTSDLGVRVAKCLCNQIHVTI